MRTKAAVLVVFVIGVAATMILMSGFASVWGTDPPQVERASDRVNESASSVSPDDEPVSGPVSSGDSSIVGLVVSGVGSIADIAGAVLLLPTTLMNLGFPAWFARPLGRLAQLVAGVGIIQFATNRLWK